MADPNDRSSDAEAGKHAQARQLAEKALRLQAAGQEAEAEALLAEATATDPTAVEAVLNEGVASRAPAFEPAQDDEDIARMSRVIEPGSAAPSRAGITDSGSGADGER